MEQVQTGLPWDLQARIDARGPRTVGELNQCIQEYQLKRKEEGMERKFITSSRPEIREGRNSQHSRRTETKSTSRREVTCYKCSQIGHISRNCPKKSFGQKMSYRDLLRKGIVNGIPTDRIVLDTGATTTIIHQRMVTEENYTGDAVTITDSGESTRLYPKVKVTIHLQGEQEFSQWLCQKLCPKMYCWGEMHQLAYLC